MDWSGGIFWDFKNNELSKDILNYYGFDPSVLPNIQPVFSNHGELLPEIAAKLNLNYPSQLFINGKYQKSITEKSLPFQLLLP